MDFNDWLKVSEKSNSKIINAESAIAEAVKLIKDFSKEQFIGLYLDVKNKVLYAEIVHIGSLNSCALYTQGSYLSPLSSIRPIALSSFIITQAEKLRRVLMTTISP